MKEEKRSKRFFWVDMEMTGLDETKCHILEVAAVVTDLEFRNLDEFHRVVRQPQEILATMDAWCTKTHGESGLAAEVLVGVPLDQVEKDLVAFLDRHFGKDRVVLCGNSIGQDRKFIDRYMPELAKRLHYRLVDVSSFKEVFRNKYGRTFEKKDRHRARDDIHESIAELAYYLTFVKGDPTVES